MRKFLIGQLGKFGDCLFATTVARQIKNDYPESHVTWAVAAKYKPIVENNPYVDAIWEIEASDDKLYRDAWNDFEAKARQRKKLGEFDELVFTQFPDKYWIRFDGTIRSSILKGYNKNITVPVAPVVRLTTEEEQGVVEFSAKHRLNAYKHVILFECNPSSKQSFVTLEYATEIAESIVATFPDTCIILTSDLKKRFASEKIIDGSALNFKQNAALSRFCTLFIGCSSGITWLMTSDIARKVNMIQLLSTDFSLFAGVKYDHEIWRLPTDHIIEITNSSPKHLSNCVADVLERSFADAKNQYDETVRPTYATFRNVMQTQILRIRYIPKIPLFIIQFHRRNRHLKWWKLCQVAVAVITTAVLHKKE